ncbi:MAG: hypothetical protein LBB90_06735, partial [Tannerella sp.]|nr:hypothetical protein [Tannerella sp.]
YTERALLAASRAEGREEGLAEGEAKGRVEGKEEGRVESLTGVVLKCQRDGFSLEQIQKITGLDGAKIQEILRSNSEE